MRTKSTEKYEALLKATLTLVFKDGFHEASMSKIAKEAAVSPATIYLYFNHKQDLINKLYLHVKQDFCRSAFADYNSTVPVKKGFEIIWNNIATYKLHHIKEAVFLHQCDNTPMVEAHIRQQGLTNLEPLTALWKKGQEEGIIKDMSPYLLYAYTIYPISFIQATHQKELLTITETTLHLAFKSAWDAIRI